MELQAQQSPPYAEENATEEVGKAPLPDRAAPPLAFLQAGKAPLPDRAAPPSPFLQDVVVERQRRQTAADPAIAVALEVWDEVMLRTFGYAQVLHAY